MWSPGHPLGSRRLAVAVPLVWSAVACYSAVQSVVLARMQGIRLSVGTALAQQAPILALWALATPLIWLSVRRLPITRAHWPSRVLSHVGLGSLFIVMLNVAIRLPILFRPGPDRLSALGLSTLEGLLTWYHLALIVYLLLVLVGHWLLHAEDRLRQEREAVELRGQVAESELRFLRTQIHPHFLFNALNAVGGLVRSNRPREATEMLGGLGDLLRGALRTREREVPLEQELELLRTYVEIERIRFADRLLVEWRLDPGVAGAMVPPLTLQPLVENSIRHGLGGTEGGRIEISATRGGGRLFLRVWDSGDLKVPRSASGSSGVGLSSIRERLALLYPMDHRLELRPAGRGGTEVVVEMPLRYMAESAPLEKIG